MATLDRILAEMPSEKVAQTSLYLFKSQEPPKEGRRYVALYEHLLQERGYRDWTEQEIEIISIIRNACHQMVKHYQHPMVRMAMVNCAENACGALKCLIEEETRKNAAQVLIDIA